MERTDLKIACIGWGSLIWNPGSLLIIREWFQDGPFLPIEFTRESIDKRLTLAITPKSKPLRTLWALMATNDLNEAKKSLCLREAKSEKNLVNTIGFVTINEEYSDETELTIQSWISRLNIDAAIWTKLPPKFNKVDNSVPTLEEAIKYLKDLDINERINAEEYVRHTPPQIDTFYRRSFEKEFGWTYLK